LSDVGISKTQRQHRIGELIAAHGVHSQAELVERLAADGVVATQATVSRDLDELGAIKVRGPEGVSVYAVPDLPFAQRGTDDRLRRTLADWVVEVGASANLVVLRTPPGSAHVVGAALDRARMSGVLGNVCGDDTVLVIALDPTGGAELARRLCELAGLTWSGAA
jgi:transcriptional regulator of arginine metabolism